MNDDNVYSFAFFISAAIISCRCLCWCSAPGVCLPTA